MADDSKDKLLEGYRRAHSWLRFNELGDEAAASELLGGMTDSDYYWISHGLRARTQWFLQRLSVTARKDLEQRHRELEPLLYDRTGQRWQAIAQEWVNVTEGLAEQWRPDRQSHLDLYEKAALDGLEAESPDSAMRRRMFGS